MNNELLRLEQELIKGCGMAQERFHRVSSAKWKGIYQKSAVFLLCVRMSIRIL